MVDLVANWDSQIEVLHIFIKIKNDYMDGS